MAKRVIFNMAAATILDFAAYQSYQITIHDRGSRYFVFFDKA